MAQNQAISVLALDIDGVITDGRVLFDNTGRESKWVSYRDIDAIFLARRLGFTIILVTAENTPWVDFIARRLEIDHVMSGISDKSMALHQTCEKLKCSMGQICYIGDSDRDAPALKIAGLGMAPKNASDKAKLSADIVLESDGGHGALYEAVTLLKADRI